MKPAACGGLLGGLQRVKGFPATRIAGRGSRTGSRWRPIIGVCAAWLCIAPCLSQPVQAQTAVDLELVLLADATGSIDNAEILFQRQGYAQAIVDPAVIAAIRDTAYGRIAVTYVEWGSATSQDTVVEWTVIDGSASAAAFAEALLEPPRRARGRNAIGAALLFGKGLIEGNDLEGFRRVIDISADSANNWNGPPIAEARAEVLAAGITINGLAVLCRTCSGRPISYDLEAAFDDQIIGGPGAFVITADGPETFAAAVRRKLVLEIAGGPVVDDMAMVR